MKQIVYIIAVILSISSCAKDELSGREDIDHSKGIRVYVDAVSHTVVETRADNEGAINDLTVLVFDTGYNLTQAAKATVFNNGEIYVKLEHSTEPRKLVVMANVQEIIDEATKPGDDPFVVGTATLTSITNKLLLHSGMIVDDPSTGGNINVMPMLSEIINEQKIDYYTTLGKPDTHETRLALKHRLTKISAVSSVPSLQIEAISLRHAPKNGGKLLFFNNAADAIPVINDADRDNYFGADDAGEGAKFPTANQPLYLFSSDNTPDSETGNNTVEMVVKAKYASDVEATYYHIRLDKKADADSTKKTLFDLEPGTHYKVVFTKVTAPGYPTLKEAIDNKYSNLEYDIVDDSGMGEILTNGQYMLNATNSDCKIYGDFDPNFEYPIADFITDAPTEAKIEITPVGNGIKVTTEVDDIICDGKTITQLKVKLPAQFTSGSVKVRVGNLTKIFTFSIELDPPYIKVDGVLEARIASGFEPRIIALSKSAYNETVKPTDLTDKLEKTSTVYFHFNKVTLGDEARIGEAYYTHQTNIHHTKVMVYQRPWVEVGGVKVATGNMVIGWSIDGKRVYKIGAATEYGILFQGRSSHAAAKRRDSRAWDKTIYAPKSLMQNTEIETRTVSEWRGANSLHELRGVITNDPCRVLSSGGADTWQRANYYQAQKIVDPAGYKFRYAPNGGIFHGSQLFFVANGSYVFNDGRQEGVEIVGESWCSYYNGVAYMSFRMNTGVGYEDSEVLETYGRSMRCVKGDDIVTTKEIRLLHNLQQTELRVARQYAQSATISYDESKLQSATINKTTGVVTVVAKYDYRITEVQKNYTTIKISANGVTKSINVVYEPIVYAKGNIVLRNGRFEIGEPGDINSLLFMGDRRKVGLESAATAPKWSTTTKYYIPNAVTEQKCEVGSGLSLDQLEVLNHRHGGDPCYFVYDPSGKKWKTARLYRPHPLMVNGDMTLNTTKYGVEGALSKQLFMENGEGVFMPYTLARETRPKEPEYLSSGIYWSISYGITAPNVLVFDRVSWAGARWGEVNYWQHLPVRCERDYSND